MSVVVVSGVVVFVVIVGWVMMGEVVVDWLVVHVMVLSWLITVNVLVSYLMSMVVKSVVMNMVVLMYAVMVAVEIMTVIILWSIVVGVFVATEMVVVGRMTMIVGGSMSVVGNDGNGGMSVVGSSEVSGSRLNEGRVGYWSVPVFVLVTVIIIICDSMSVSSHLGSITNVIAISIVLLISSTVKGQSVIAFWCLDSGSFI